MSDTPRERKGLFGRIARALRGGGAVRAGVDAEAGPLLRLAAFGKHGGAEDHDEIGVSTDALTAVRRSLYTNGIAGNLDADEWDGLQQDERVPTFGHEFLWDRVGVLHVGRIWPSRDAKGRERYPMVACSQTTGLRRSWVLSNVSPALERLELDFQYVTSPDAARRLVGETERALQAAAEAATATPNNDVSAADVPAWSPASAYGLLTTHADLGPDGRGVLNLFFAVDHELVGFRVDDAESNFTTMLRMSRHLRLPACGLTPAVRACDLWITALRPLLLPGASILAVRPHAREWVDVVVGEPTRDEIYPILATRKKVPLTTDIPYAMEPAFLDEARRRIAALQEGPE